VANHEPWLQERKIAFVGNEASAHIQVSKEVSCGHAKQCDFGAPCLQIELKA
jgi:hypothetical protein